MYAQHSAKKELGTTLAKNHLGNHFGLMVPLQHECQGQESHDETYTLDAMPLENLHLHQQSQSLQ